MEEDWAENYKEEKKWTETPAHGFNYIGQPGLRRKDGYEKASGKAIFARDVQFPGMLYAKLISSPYSNCRIKSMDTSKAEALPGVRGILRYDDPGMEEEHAIPFYGPDQFLLPGDAHYWGQPMGVAVAADSEEICEQALKLVEIEWEELPFVVDKEEALEPDAPIARPDLGLDTNLIGEGFREIGDVEAGFAEADKIIEFEVRMREQVWAGVEGLCCVARWQGDYLEAWCHHQCPWDIQWYLSRSTPMHKVKITMPYQGSIFGGIGWEIYTDMFPRLADLLARKTDRPVKMLWAGSMFHGYDGAESHVKYKIGAKNDGTITAVQVDGASYGNLSRVTKIPNLQSTTTSVHTNRGPSVVFRAGVGAHFIFKSVFDHVSAELGLDPMEVALKNDGCGGVAMAELADYKSENGFDPGRDSLTEVIEAGKKSIGWDEKWHEPGTKKLPNGKMHGIGFSHQYTWSHNPLGFTVGLFARADGTISILGRRADIGTDAQSSFVRIVADELGMKYEDVDHRPFDDVGHDLHCPHGSSGSVVSNGPALIDASRKLRWRILELATSTVYGKVLFPDKTIEELDIQDSVVFEKANPDNKMTVKEVTSAYKGAWWQGPKHAPCASWGFSHKLDTKGLLDLLRNAYWLEVEVDTETGGIEITNVVTVHDVGKVVNPEGVNAMQYGGAHMGTGRARSEDKYRDPQTGVVLNANLLDYKYNSMLDLGPVDCIIVETRQGYGAYGMFGMGEQVGSTMSSCLGYAVHNAIGEWVDDYPFTPDKILKALGKA